MPVGKETTGLLFATACSVLELSASYLLLLYLSGAGWKKKVKTSSSEDEIPTSISLLHPESVCTGSLAKNKPKHSPTTA